jgi:hypothetical protein
LSNISRSDHRSNWIGGVSGNVEPWKEEIIFCGKLWVLAEFPIYEHCMKEFMLASSSSYKSKERNIADNSSEKFVKKKHELQIVT